MKSKLITDGKEKIFTIEEFLLDVINAIRKNLEGSGDFKTVFILLNDKGFCVFDAEVYCDAAKENLLKKVRTEAAEKQAIAAIFVSIVFPSAFSEENKNKLLKYGNINDFAMVSLETDDGYQEGFSEIITRQDGTKTFGKVEMKPTNDDDRLIEWILPQKLNGLHKFKKHAMLYKYQQVVGNC